MFLLLLVIKIILFITFAMGITFFIMKKYKIHEKDRFRKDFLLYFPDIRLEDLCDSLFSVINGYITIDILKFGRRIERLYPEEWDVMSISEIVERHYGSKAKEFLNAII